MAEAASVDVELNLRGEVCPYTFVKSKLALEDMEIGQVLRVIVDHEPAIHNVPRSMADEGQAVLGIEPTSPGEWAITIRKQR